MMNVGWLYRHSRGFGSNIILTGVGSIVLGLMASVVTVDTAFYFATQNQLQTAVDAAALAGGSHMFEGQEVAREAALDLAMANDVAGMELTANDLEINSDGGSFSVSAQKTVPTIMANFVCALSGKAPGQLVDGQAVEDLNGDGQADGTDGCSYMTVYARSKAIGSPRDTVLVLDTSSSMESLGHGQPLKDVKKAAHAFVDMVVEMEAQSPDSVDKVALVKFDRASSLVRRFTSTQESPNLSNIKNDISNLRIYSGSGWNTNYESGLKVALDEIQRNSRPTSHKTIIFFTDGEPNLPEGNTAITSCLYYQSRKQYSQAKSCTQNYVNYMISRTNLQVERARAMGVTIHTIQISDSEAGSSLALLQDLLQKPYWKPGLLDTMADETEGKQYQADSADGETIKSIFQNVAKIMNIRLATY